MFVYYSTNDRRSSSTFSKGLLFKRRSVHALLIFQREGALTFYLENVLCRGLKYTIARVPTIRHRTYILTMPII